MTPDVGQRDHLERDRDPTAWGPRHSQSRGSRQGGPTPESFGCFGIEGPEVDAIKKALVKAQDVAREQPVLEGVYGAFHQAHRQFEVSVGGRDRIIGAESRQVGEVGVQQAASVRRFAARSFAVSLPQSTPGTGHAVPRGSEG